MDHWSDGFCTWIYCFLSLDQIFNSGHLVLDLIICLWIQSLTAYVYSLSAPLVSCHLLKMQGMIPISNCQIPQQPSSLRFDHLSGLDCIFISTSTSYFICINDLQLHLPCHACQPFITRLLICFTTICIWTYDVQIQIWIRTLIRGLGIRLLPFKYILRIRIRVS